RGTAGKADAFDHVGIKRALREKVGASDLLRFSFKYVDELCADELALGFGVRDALKPFEEIRAGIHVYERDVVAVAEERDDLLGLAQAHEAMVDEYASQLVADCFMDEDGGNGAVDASRKAADHTAITDLLANVGDLGLAEARHGPVAGATADVAHEIRE